jgi:tRNA(Arg) A34 adenosine deaminase TadA
MGSEFVSTTSDGDFMRRAIFHAKEAEQREGAAGIGCVIVLDGAIIGEGSNEVALRCDPTAHE